MEPGRPAALAATDTRARILAILEELVDLPVDPSRGFIALGGDSIRAMQAAARTRRQVGVRLRADALLVAESVDQAIAMATSPEPTEEVLDGPSPPPAAASRGQQQLWFVDAFAEEPGLYNIASAIHFAGQPAFDHLVAAITATLAAHESLRTVFREGDEGLTRVVLPADSVALRRHDLRDRDDAEAAYRQLAAEAAGERFSLDRGPVARAALVRRREDLCSLVLVAHHTAVDAWSLGLLCEEITARYVAAPEGREPSGLAREPFESFVAAEALARAARGERDLRWWRDYLIGAPTTLPLASERERPPAQSFAGARLGFEPAGDPERLRALARELAVTPFVLLLAAFGVCVHREAGQADFLVGIPLAGRDRPELQDVVGFCAKLLPVRIVVGDPGESFDRFARRLQTSLAMVVEHASIDLADLVRELSLSGDPSRNRLVQFVFAKHDDLAADGAIVPGIELKMEDLDTRHSPVDLTLFVESLRQPMVATFEYATAVVTEPEVGRLAASYSRLLQAILADPRQPLERIAGGSGAE